jgi:hypothetical protein
VRLQGETRAVGRFHKGDVAAEDVDSRRGDVSDIIYLSVLKLYRAT